MVTFVYVYAFTPVEDNNAIEMVVLKLIKWIFGIAKFVRFIMLSLFTFDATLIK